MKTIENIQSIILDLKGNIISSDNNLFDVKKLSSKCVLDWSPFVESIFPTLLQKKTFEAATFEKVKTIHTFLRGSYDYSFFYSKDGKSIVWVISDCSIYYSDLYERQQFHHQCVMFKQINRIGENHL